MYERTAFCMVEVTRKALRLFTHSSICMLLVVFFLSYVANQGSRNAFSAVMRFFGSYVSIFFRSAMEVLETLFHSGPE